MDFDALASTGGEEACAPAPGMPAGESEPWRIHHFRPGQPGNAAAVCNLHEAGGASWTMIYTFAYLYCDEEHRDLTMGTGSDDALLVVLNGERVLKVQTQRGYAIDQEKTPGIVLRKGWNRLLCKVDDYMGGMGLFIRFSTPEGKLLVDEIRICFERPAALPADRQAAPVFVDGVKYEDDASARLRDAVRLAMDDGEFATAAAMCRKVAEEFPKSQSAPEALFHAGEYLVRAGGDDGAVAAFDQVQLRFPFSPWAANALLARAEVLEKQGNAKALEATLEDLLARFPKNVTAPGAMRKLAVSQRARGDYDAADRTLARLLAAHAEAVEAAEAVELRGDNQMSRGRKAEAVALWKQALEKAEKLGKGRYVWDIAAVAILGQVADRCRVKIAGD